MLHWFRRLRVPWEIRDDIHEAFLSLACGIICWRRLASMPLCQVSSYDPVGNGTFLRKVIKYAAKCHDFPGPAVKAPSGMYQGWAVADPMLRGGRVAARVQLVSKKNLGGLAMRALVAGDRGYTGVVLVAFLRAAEHEAPRELVQDEAFNIGRPEDNVHVRDVAELARGAVPGSTVSFACVGRPAGRSRCRAARSRKRLVDGLIPTRLRS